MAKKFGVAVILFLLSINICIYAIGENTLVGLYSDKMAFIEARVPERVDWLYGPGQGGCGLDGSKVFLQWDGDDSGRQSGYVIFLAKRRSSYPPNVYYGYTVDIDGYYYQHIEILKTTRKTSCTIDLKKPGTYYLTIYSYYDSPLLYLSDHSGLAKVVISNKIGKPKNVKVKQTGSYKVELTWEAADNAVSYEIYRADGSGAFRIIGETKKLRFLDKKAKNGIKFKYKIKAINYFGKTTFSNVVRAYPMDRPSLKANVDGNKIIITWEKIKNAKKYKIYTKEPKDEEFYYLKTVTAPKVNITVTRKGTYQYYVIPVVDSFEGLSSRILTVEYK